MNKLIILFILIFIGFVIYTILGNTFRRESKNPISTPNQQVNEGGLEMKDHPLSIESLRKGDYPGSEFVIEQILTPGSNYQRYIASYKSEGLKIFGLLTIPNGTAPKGGWPAIIFNHGYISPSVYRTTEKYVAYTDGFSRNGYVLFKPDFRGHGSSEGVARGGYGSNDYTIDVLNAVSSVKKLKYPSNYPSSEERGDESRSLVEDSSRPFDKLRARTVSIVNPERIGMWGHSMGGHITLRSMVVNKDIKAGVIWAGVVASYPDLLERWRRRPWVTPLPGNTRGSWRQGLIDQYGSPEENSTFWDSISANSYLSEISGPLQLHHATSDTHVPVEFSEKLYEELQASGKEVKLYTYPGDDHNISANFGVAMQRSVEFFYRYLK